MRALWELRHSRRTRWGLGLGSAAFMVLLAFLAVRHFATTSWPLSRGKIGVVLTGRFDDAMRIAVVRCYPGCPAGLRAISLSLSLVMLGLIARWRRSPPSLSSSREPGSLRAPRSRSWPEPGSRPPR
jgi:hypothetical protein